MRRSRSKSAAPHGDLDAWTLGRDYYLYGQFSRFVPRGSVRIASEYGSADTVTNVVFRTPHGEMVAILVNQTTRPQQVTLVSADGQIETSVPAATVSTYRWPTTHATAIDRWAQGWSASASEFSSDAVRTPDGDNSTAWRSNGPQ